VQKIKVQKVTPSTQPTSQEGSKQDLFSPNSRRRQLTQNQQNPTSMSEPVTLAMDRSETSVPKPRKFVLKNKFESDLYTPTIIAEPKTPGVVYAQKGSLQSGRQMQADIPTPLMRRRRTDNLAEVQIQSTSFGLRANSISGK
jgi:hypothetical protein